MTFPERHFFSQKMYTKANTKHGKKKKGYYYSEGGFEMSSHYPKTLANFCFEFLQEFRMV